MNEKQLERMRIRAERYANALEKAIYEDIGIGKHTGFDHCVAVEKTVSRFLAKLPNNLSFEYLDNVCHWIDLIINKDDGNCSACFSPESFSIEVKGMDATHYYKSGADKCRFENFNSDIAGMIADCFCEKFDDTDWDGNHHWLFYYKPMPYKEFEKELRYDLIRSIKSWIDGGRASVDVYDYEVTSFDDFCEGFLCDFDINEVVKTNTPQELAESYVNLYIAEIYQQYVNWHAENLDENQND